MQQTLQSLHSSFIVDNCTIKAYQSLHESQKCERFTTEARTIFYISKKQYIFGLELKKKINIFSPVNSCCGKFEIISVYCFPQRQSYGFSSKLKAFAFKYIKGSEIIHLMYTLALKAAVSVSGTFLPSKDLMLLIPF